MKLWIQWWKMVKQLRPVCSRKRTFLWLVCCLAGITIRGDLFGVTSIVRALGLKDFCYDRLLDLFHSSALKLEQLTEKFKSMVLKWPLVKFNGRAVVVGDGLKVSKEGRKMPAVKKLYQESESNSKARYIYGHLCQSVAILAGSIPNVFAVPIASRIHDGVIFSNRDKRTLLDKMVQLINSLDIGIPFYFTADAYYATGGIIKGLLAGGNHLVTRVRSNAVAYLPAKQKKTGRKRGRPKKYGKKLKLRELLKNTDDMARVESPVYADKKGTLIHFKTMDLLWRPVGILVRFVLVVHPARGKIILMSSDLTLSGIDIIQIYGLRFKIEVSFKQALRTLGTYAYHFWMRTMKPDRKKTGNQYLHRESKEYRKAVKRKIRAYHNYIQIGIIAQGLLQYLSLSFPRSVWNSYGSWMRTVRLDACPSEMVTAIALKNTFPYFLSDSFQTSILTKFLIKRIDFNRIEGVRMIA